jgi:ATP/maltotriose-dependent transcriptional regulator MalT
LIREITIHSYMKNYKNNQDTISRFAEKDCSDLNNSRNYDGVLKHRICKKRHLSWEEADSQSDGLFTRNIHLIVKHFSSLTLMELKTCALIKSMKGSWEISEILGISEHTVENHRVNIRKKIGIKKGGNLSIRLLGL